jgi:hypothetical protein
MGLHGCHQTRPVSPQSREEDRKVPAVAVPDQMGDFSGGIRPNKCLCGGLDWWMSIVVRTDQMSVYHSGIRLRCPWRLDQTRWVSHVMGPDHRWVSIVVEPDQAGIYNGGISPCGCL